MKSQTSETINGCLQLPQQNDPRSYFYQIIKNEHILFVIMISASGMINSEFHVNIEVFHKT